MLSLCKIRNKSTPDHFLGLFFSSCRYCSPLIFYPCASIPPSLSHRLTPFWSLKADCFLIGVVPGVMVVMETCKGHLEGLDGGCWVRVGKGYPLEKTEGSFYPRLRWSLQKMDWVLVWQSFCAKTSTMRTQLPTSAGGLRLSSEFILEAAFPLDTV